MARMGPMVEPKNSDKRQL